MKTVEQSTHKIEQITLLSPFSIHLEKQPFTTIQNEPVFVSGDYRIYKLYDRHFLHTFKNVIIGERCGKNTEMIENVKNDITPVEKKYF